MRVGFPYQYDQAVWRARLFLAGFAARLALSKLAARLPLLPCLLAPPAALGVLEGQPYVTVWKRAQRTTRTLQAAGPALVALAALKVARAMLLLP